MLGSLAGDIIGSIYEFGKLVFEELGEAVMNDKLDREHLFSDKVFFTDDTILTVATANKILSGSDYASEYYRWASKYKNRGFGGNFKRQLSRGKLEPYNSFGNGSAMRISPVGWLYSGFTETLNESKESAECTHDHEEGIKGAQAIALSIWASRQNYTKDDIRKLVEDLGYDLSTKSDEFPDKFDVSCQGTIPRCMAIFFESDSFEIAMKKGIMMGGDVDTNCAIVGSMIEAHHGLPDYIAEEVYLRIPVRMANVVNEFTKKYINKDFIEPDVEIGSKIFEISRD
jgi:ADP-ribosylglycohydrolase